MGDIIYLFSEPIMTVEMEDKPSQVEKDGGLIELDENVEQTPFERKRTEKLYQELIKGMDEFI